MPCYHPITAYKGRNINADTGKRPVVFNHKEGYNDYKISLPCGRCIGCRLERSRQWAVRCMHEASLHTENCFITLTFRDACPLDGTRTDPTASLHKHHFQRFMKRLRKAFPDKKIRYFHCGEYGEKLGRPHHHACLFGFDFPDKVLWSKRDNVRLYRSKTLEDLWPFGNSTIGDVTFESAAYVARYIVKKVLGKDAKSYYEGRTPEYCTMSRRPGLASAWFDKFKEDLFPNDFVVVRGRKMKVPKYYSAKLEKENLRYFNEVRSDRVCASRSNPDNNPDRREDAETIKLAQVSLLKRSVENC